MLSVDDHGDIFDVSVCADYVLENAQRKENCREYSRQVGKHMNYVVADFLIRIKNASAARRKEVVMPYSNINKAIAKVLIKEGFLADVKEVEADGHKVLKVGIRYARRKPVVTEVEIISKPSLRRYSGKRAISLEERRDALMTVLSTSQGIMTGKEAMKKGIGGELLFKIG